MAKTAATTLQEKPTTHRTLVLVLTVTDDYFDTVYAAVAALRGGFMRPYAAGDDTEAWSYHGPFEVNETDRAIIEALADDIEGQDEGPASDNEPRITEGRIIRAVARTTATDLIASRGAS